MSRANSIQYRRFASDFPYKERGNLWTDTLTGSFTGEKMYVVQTNPKVVERCLLMTSDPGDLVLDPTCGSGTTAWCARKVGTPVDHLRHLAGARRARPPADADEHFRLPSGSRSPTEGPPAASSTGANRTGRERRSAASCRTSPSNPSPTTSRRRRKCWSTGRRRDGAVTRVSGPFCIEATIPTPVDWEGDGEEDSGDAGAVDAYADHVERMIEVLRRSPILHLGGRATGPMLSRVRKPARTMSLSAEALIEGDGERTAAIVFGPEKRRGLGDAGVRGGARRPVPRATDTSTRSASPSSPTPGA